jgi:hypothetical protein
VFKPSFFLKFISKLLSNFASPCPENGKPVLMKPSLRGSIRPLKRHCVLMNYEVYTGLVVSDDFNQFDFVSMGKKGPIRKRVAFTMTELDNIYNLAFGDLGENGEIDDLTVSDK